MRFVKPAVRLALLSVAAAYLCLPPPSRTSRLSRPGRSPERLAAPSAHPPTPAPHRGVQDPARVREHLIPADPFPEGATTQERETPADPQGQFERVRVLRTSFKYPLVRIVETVARPPAGGPERVLRRVEMAADHVVVRLRPGVKEEDLQQLAGKQGARIRKKALAQGTYLVELAGADLDAVTHAVEAFTKEAHAVAYAEPDYLVHAIATPNDPRLGELWGLHNTGQTGGIVDADVDASEAWDLSTGNLNVRVGVIDTGVDYTHEDLVANIWTNPGEIPGNGRDDDGNGLVDDVRGWDFAGNDNDPMDDHYHGTHVAGTIGAVGNNGKGIAGVCWNVSIVPLKFLDAGGRGATSDAVDAITYATTIGVHLTSNSWGGGGASQSLRDAIAGADQAGILFVAAAGNSSVDTDLSANFPSSYDLPNIIAVAATDHADTLAGFSNYGAVSVDLGAPGVAVLSCVPANQYRRLSGTSMATPHVSGVCALMKSRVPALTHAQVKSFLLSSVDPVPALSGTSATGGRLNAFKALVISSGPYPTLQSSSTLDNGTGGTSGNSDGICNPGERIGLQVALVNGGSQTANGVTASLALASPSPWVTVVAGTASFGDISPAASRPGSAPYLLDVHPGAPTPTAVPLTLTIQDAAARTWNSSLGITIYTSFQIRGTARLDGAPLQGVTITFTGPLSGSATTAADGTYLFGGIDGTYTLVARKAGLLDSTPRVIAVPPPASAVDFSFTSATVSGLVTDQGSGSPLAGATVTFGGPTSASATTAADGRYSFTLGYDRTVTYVVQASKPDTHSPSSARNVTVPPSAPGVDFQLVTFQYGIVDLGTLGGTTEAYALNGLGHAVGMSQNAQGNFHAFRWVGGVMTDLGTISTDTSASSQGFAINDAGQVVGTSGTIGNASRWSFLWQAGAMASITGNQAFDINESGQIVVFDNALSRSFLWENGLTTNLGSLGGGAAAWGINNAGHVVGDSNIAPEWWSARHAFLWRNGAMSDLGTLAGGNSTAQDVNNFGQVVGWSGTQAFLWQNGAMTGLQTTFPDNSYAYAINDTGKIVGYTESNIGGNPRASLWDNGKLIDLNTLIPANSGWVLTRARDINNAGQIVGYGSLGGATRGFLLNPVTTPANAGPTITAGPSATPNPVRPRPR